MKKKIKHIVNLSIAAYPIFFLNPIQIVAPIIRITNGLQALNADIAQPVATRNGNEKKNPVPKLQNEICRSVKRQLKDGCRFMGLCETI